MKYLNKFWEVNDKYEDLLLVVEHTHSNSVELSLMTAFSVFLEMQWATEVSSVLFFMREQDSAGCLALLFLQPQ